MKVTGYTQIKIILGVVIGIISIELGMHLASLLVN